MRTKFTTEQKNVYDLSLDLMRGDYSLHVDKDKVSKKDLEDYLRDRINNDILKGATLYQAVRRNNITMFEIIEEIVNVAIAEDVFDSPFVNEFVEVKNRALGDKTSFYAEGGLLSVSTFAGNHWDTNREALDLGGEITLPKEWIFIHVYEDLERFLLGITSIDKLMDKIYKSINKYIQDRIYLQFNNVAQATLPSFNFTGNSEDAVGQACDAIQSAGGYNNLIIAGTKGALRKLANVVPDKMFADSQKEAKAMTGSIAEWEGNRLMVIPQVGKFTNAGYNLQLNDNKLFILGDNGTKPIKLEYFGDSRTKMIEDSTVLNDMSIDLQVQTKIGMGLVLSNYFGVFTFSS